MSGIILTKQSTDLDSPGGEKAVGYFMNDGTFRLRDDDAIYQFNLGNNAAIVDFNYSLGATTDSSLNDFSYTSSDELVKIGSNSFWEADLTGGSQWASIDLGSAIRIDKIVVKHWDGVYDDEDFYITPEFKIQWSDDNSAWIDYNYITGNTSAVNTYTASLGISHRYWRIYVISGRSDTPPGEARIKRLQLIKTTAVTISIDADGNSYVVMPDSSIYYIRKMNWLDLFALDTSSGYPAPVHGTGRLTSDGFTLSLIDEFMGSHLVLFKGIGDYTLKTGVTVTSTAETDIHGTGLGSTAYSQIAVAGYDIRQKLRGAISTNATTPGDLTYNIYMGSTVVASTGAIALPTNLTDALFEVEADITILVQGFGGSLMTLGTLDIFTLTGRTSFPIFNQSGIGTPVSMSTIGSFDLSHKTQFSIGSVNSLTSLQMQVQVINQY